MPELRANAGACGEMRQVGRRAIARGAPSLDYRA